MENYNNIKVGQNKVLIRLEKFNDTLTLANGTELALDYKYRPEVHTQVVGYVADLPDNLYFNPSDIANSMEWETPMELRKGDKVYMQYLAVILALADRYDYAASYPNPSWLYINNEMHIIIDYSTIYFAIRDNSIKMLNGFCIAHPITVDNSHHNFHLQDEIKDSNRFGQMVLPGSPLTGFIDKQFQDCGPISKDDIFLFEYYANIRVEHTVHQRFNKGTDYFVVQRNWIYSKFNKDIKEQIKNSKVK